MPKRDEPSRRGAFYRLLGVTFLLLASSMCFSRSLPNIVLILTDDQGYGDLGAFGATHLATPNLDALAADGVRFTNFYSASSVCSPSRAALLTGSYPLRVGIPNVLFPNGAWGTNPNRGLHPDEETIADLLRTQGYATAMAGKWHLGHRPALLPTRQGFDDYFGIPFSNDMTIVPSMKLASNIQFNSGWTEETIQDIQAQANGSHPPLMKNEEVIEVPVTQDTMTRRLTDYAVNFISSNAGKRPFFLYFAHSMPHVPLHTDINFKGISGKGIYADVIQEIDWSVGQLVSALSRHGVRDNTLIFFLSDNGPWRSYGNHGGNSGGLRGGKFDVWEGGFRVPAIASWPAQIPRGKVNNHVISTIDILPTLAYIAGTKPPGRMIDGVNIIESLTGGFTDELGSRHFYYFLGSQLAAVRKSQWKYVFEHTGHAVLEPGENGENGRSDFSVEVKEALYDLSRDRAESTNLIERYPSVASALRAEGLSFATKLTAGARPSGVASSN